MRALLIESRPSSLLCAAAALQDAGITFERAEAAEDTCSLVRHYDFDLIIVSLYGEDIGPIRRIRDAAIDLPILAISDREDENLMVKALHTGADDFVCEPTSGLALIARCKALIRRSHGFSQSVLEVGPLSINMDTREVTVFGRRMRLPAKEYLILELLALRKGASVTKESILNHIYGGMDEPEPKIIDVLVCKLRKKLVQAGASNLITTVWGRGYILRENSDAPAPFEIVDTSEIKQLTGWA